MRLTHSSGVRTRLFLRIESHNPNFTLFFYQNSDQKKEGSRKVIGLVLHWNPCSKDDEKQSIEA